MIYFSGFADEAAQDLDRQIEATKALGWNRIESRNVDGMNIIDLDERAFEVVCEKLDGAQIQINCFGSAVANHGTDVRDDNHVRRSLDQMKRAVPRMQRLGTQMIRGMSYAIPKDSQPDAQDIRSKVIRNLRELVRICEDNGLVYVHENCMCYGGLSSDHALDLVAEINSPAFQLVYDTGNPVFSLDWTDRPPAKLQDSWQFYQAVKEHIHYVHIKDAVFLKNRPGETFPDARHTFPGEGDGCVRRIVEDLILSGYGGGLSIEPHMVVRPQHEGEEESTTNKNLSTYIEYGRRLMRIVGDIQGG